MKRFALAGLLLAACCRVALAANATPTPIVPPTETGENSAGQQQVTDMARFKPGSGTLAAIGSGTSFTGTLNTASGVITLTGMTLGGSGTADATLTLTNSKAQTGDFVICQVATFTGVTAGAVPDCAPQVTATGTITFQFSNASVTAMTASTIVMDYLIITTGNPN